MKSFKLFLTVVIVLMTSFSVLAYEEIRNFSMEVKTSDILSVDTGAGDLFIEQVDNLDRIEIEAVIRIENASSGEVADILDEDLRLTMERNGSNVHFRSHFSNNIVTSGFLNFIFGGTTQKYIDVHIKTPYIERIRIDDSSGDIALEGISVDLDLNDNSGEIELLGCSGNWLVDDGSGDIFIDNFSGQLDIDDNSGDINIADSLVDIKIDDGSGQISLKSIIGNVDIKDGSGDIRVDNLSDSIEIDDGSGDIILHNIGGDVTIWDAGSGDVRLRNISGQVKNYDE
ncbi:MAG: DUF4097 family beta strand repeat-containing protein [Halanaerobiales bacterium]